MFPLPRGAASLFFILSCTLIVVKAATTTEPRVVCYYTNWSVYRPGTAKFNPQNINPYLCTHLIYAFGGFTKDNTLKPFDKYQDIEKGGYAKFTGLKTYNKNLKTMLAIGGWNEASSRFSPLVANPDRRHQFVKNTVKFLRQNHFDGLDLDWEYPAFRDGGKPRDKENYALFVQELRQEFDRESSKTGRPRLLLTMAVPAGVEYIGKGYDIPKLNKYLDWFNILTYDYHSAFEPAVNHHAPLLPLEEDNEYNYDTELNIDHTVKFYLNEGADRDKLVIGIPTYGRSYTLFNADSTDIGAPADGPGEQGDATREKGYLAYYEICQNIKEDDEWVVVQPNTKAMGPYAYKDNQWVGYDDEAIAKKKAIYVAENGLGGIMFWSIDNDDFRGLCTGKPYPIIEAAKEALLDSLGVGVNDISAPVHKKTKPSRSRSRNREQVKNIASRYNSDEEEEEEIEIKRKPVTIKKNTSDFRKTNSRRRGTTTLAPKTTTESSSLVVRSRTTPEPPTTPDPGSDFKCEEEGFYPHPRDCKKYFWCLDSGPSNLGIVAHQFTCPSGLVFNKQADSCDYARNVICAKTQSKPAPVTLPPVTQSTAAIFKSRTTARPTTARTTTTTEAYEEEEEYEDEVDEEDNPTRDIEDPRVIKELIDLIKKAGGIEELEKQLKLQEEGIVTEKPNGGPTTAPLLSKTLVEKFLNRPVVPQSQNRYSLFNRKQDKIVDEVTESAEPATVIRPSSDNKYSSVIRTTNSNSRGGPQNAGLEKLPEFDSFLKEKPKYVTIQRTRPTATTESSVEVEQEVNVRHRPLGYVSSDEDEVEDDDDEVEEEVVVQNSRQPVSNFATTQHPQYVNIRRTRPSTKAPTEDSVEEEDSDDESIKRVSYTTQSNTPEPQQYVSISRRRPTTTASTPIVETTTESDLSPTSATTSRYKIFQRSRGTTTTTAVPTTTTELSATATVASLKEENVEISTTSENGVNGVQSTYSPLIYTTTNTPETTRAYANIARRTTTTTTLQPSLNLVTTTTDTIPITTQSEYTNINRIDSASNIDEILNIIDTTTELQIDDLIDTVTKTQEIDTHDDTNKNEVTTVITGIDGNLSNRSTTTVDKTNNHLDIKTNDKLDNRINNSAISNDSLGIDLLTNQISNNINESSVELTTFETSTSTTTVTPPTTTSLSTTSKPELNLSTAAVSNPRPFGFPGRRTRPTKATRLQSTTASPTNATASGPSSDTNKLFPTRVPPKVSSSINLGNRRYFGSRKSNIATAQFDKSQTSVEVSNESESNEQKDDSITGETETESFIITNPTKVSLKPPKSYNNRFSNRESSQSFSNHNNVQVENLVFESQTDEFLSSSPRPTRTRTSSFNRGPVRYRPPSLTNLRDYSNYGNRPQPTRPYRPRFDGDVGPSDDEQQGDYIDRTHHLSQYNDDLSSINSGDFSKYRPGVTRPPISTARRTRPTRTTTTKSPVSENVENYSTTQRNRINTSFRNRFNTQNRNGLRIKNQEQITEGEDKEVEELPESEEISEEITTRKPVKPLANINRFTIGGYRNARVTINATTESPQKLASANVNSTSDETSSGLIKPIYQRKPFRTNGIGQDTLTESSRSQFFGFTGKPQNVDSLTETIIEKTTSSSNFKRYGGSFKEEDEEPSTIDYSLLITDTPVISLQVSDQSIRDLEEHNKPLLFTLGRKLHFGGTGAGVSSVVQQSSIDRDESATVKNLENDVTEKLKSVTVTEKPTTTEDKKLEDSKIIRIIPITKQLVQKRPVSSTTPLSVVENNYLGNDDGVTISSENESFVPTTEIFTSDTTIVSAVEVEGTVNKTLEVHNVTETESISEISDVSTTRNSNEQDNNEATTSQSVVGQRIRRPYVPSTSANPQKLDNEEEVTERTKFVPSINRSRLPQSGSNITVSAEDDETITVQEELTSSPRSPSTGFDRNRRPINQRTKNTETESNVGNEEPNIQRPTFGGRGNIRRPLIRRPSTTAVSEIDLEQEDNIQNSEEVKVISENEKPNIQRPTFGSRGNIRRPLIRRPSTTAASASNLEQDDNIENNEEVIVSSENEKPNIQRPSFGSRGNIRRPLIRRPSTTAASAIEQEVDIEHSEEVRVSSERPNFSGRQRFRRPNFQSRVSTTAAPIEDVEHSEEKYANDTTETNITSQRSDIGTGPRFRRPLLRTTTTESTEPKSVEEDDQNVNVETGRQRISFGNNQRVRRPLLARPLSTEATIDLTDENKDDNSTIIQTSSPRNIFGTGQRIRKPLFQRPSSTASSSLEIDDVDNDDLSIDGNSLEHNDSKSSGSNVSTDRTEFIDENATTIQPSNDEESSSTANKTTRFVIRRPIARRPVSLNQQTSTENHTDSDIDSTTINNVSGNPEETTVKTSTPQSPRGFRTSVIRRPSSTIEPPKIDNEEDEPQNQTSKIETTSEAVLIGGRQRIRRPLFQRPSSTTTESVQLEDTNESHEDQDTPIETTSKRVGFGNGQRVRPVFGRTTSTTASTRIETSTQRISFGNSQRIRRPLLRTTSTTTEASQSYEDSEEDEDYDESEEEDELPTIQTSSQRPRFGSGSRFQRPSSTPPSFQRTQNTGQGSQSSNIAQTGSTLQRPRFGGPGLPRVRGPLFQRPSSTVTTLEENEESEEIENSEEEVEKIETSSRKTFGIVPRTRKPLFSRPSSTTPKDAQVSTEDKIETSSRRINFNTDQRVRITSLLRTSTTSTTPEPINDSEEHQYSDEDEDENSGSNENDDDEDHDDDDDEATPSSIQSIVSSTTESLNATNDDQDENVTEQTTELIVDDNESAINIQSNETINSNQTVSGQRNRFVIKRIRRPNNGTTERPENEGESDEIELTTFAPIIESNVETNNTRRRKIIRKKINKLVQTDENLSGNETVIESNHTDTGTPRLRKVIRLHRPSSTTSADTLLSNTPSSTTETVQINESESVDNGTVSSTQHDQHNDTQSIDLENSSKTDNEGNSTTSVVDTSTRISKAQDLSPSDINILMTDKDSETSSVKVEGGKNLINIRPIGFRPSTSEKTSIEKVRNGDEISEENDEEDSEEANTESGEVAITTPSRFKLIGNNRPSFRPRRPIDASSTTTEASTTSKPYVRIYSNSFNVGQKPEDIAVTSESPNGARPVSFRPTQKGTDAENNDSHELDVEDEEDDDDDEISEEIATTRKTFSLINRPRFQPSGRYGENRSTISLKPSEPTKHESGEEESDEEEIEKPLTTKRPPIRKIIPVRRPSFLRPGFQQKATPSTTPTTTTSNRFRPQLVDEADDNEDVEESQEEHDDGDDNGETSTRKYQNRPGLLRPNFQRPAFGNNRPGIGSSTTIHPASQKNRLQPSVETSTRSYARKFSTSTQESKPNLLDELDISALNERNRKIFNKHKNLTKLSNNSSTNSSSSSNTYQINSNTSSTHQQNLSQEDVTEQAFDSLTIIPDTTDPTLNNLSTDENTLTTLMDSLLDDIKSIQLNTTSSTLNITQKINDENNINTTQNITSSQSQETQGNLNDPNISQESSITSGTQSSILSPNDSLASKRMKTTTTLKPTTLHHVFAIDYDSLEDKRGAADSGEEVSKRLEKLVEINRIVEIYSKQEKHSIGGKSNSTTISESSNLVVEQVPTLENLGQINRWILVKLQGNKTSNGTGSGDRSSSGSSRGSHIQKTLRIDSKSYTTDYSPTDYPATSPFVPVRNSIPDEYTTSKPKIEVEIPVKVIPLQKKSSRNLVLPESIFNVETSTISLEGLFDREREGKQSNLDREGGVSIVYATTPLEPVYYNHDPLPYTLSRSTETTSTTPASTTTTTTQTTTTTTTTTTTETPTINHNPVYTPDPHYVRALAPALRPESNETNPLVISIANLDQVILKKVERKPTETSTTVIKSNENTVTNEIISTTPDDLTTTTVSTTTVINQNQTKPDESVQIKPINVDQENSSEIIRRAKEVNKSDFEVKKEVKIVEVPATEERKILKVRPQFRPNFVRRPTFNARVTTTTSSPGEISDTTESINTVSPFVRRTRPTRPSSTVTSSTQTSSFSSANKQNSSSPKAVIRRKFVPKPVSLLGGERRQILTTTTRSPDTDISSEPPRTQNPLFRRRFTFTKKPATTIQTTTTSIAPSTVTPAAVTTVEFETDQEAGQSIVQDSKYTNQRYNQIGEPTSLDDIGEALQAISKAPLPYSVTTTTTTPRHRVTDYRDTTESITEYIQYRQPSTRRMIDVTTPKKRLLSRRPAKPTQQTTTIQPRNGKDTIVQRRKPQPFEKVQSSIRNDNEYVKKSYRPVIDYDYYDDGDTRIVPNSKSQQVKVVLHGRGIIECLDQGNFPHPLSCRKFISCAKMETGGVVGWEYTCPKGLSYDPVGGICNWAAGLGCNE